MPSKVNLQPIYSPEHYRMKILVRGEAFQSELQQLYKAWESHGVPVPTQGFKRVKGYYSWVEKLRDACNKARDSQEAMDAMKQVNDDPSLSPTEKIWRRLEARESFLPPTPHGAVDRLLKACGLDPKNEQYRQFLTTYIFFGQKEYSEPFFTVQGRRNKETDEMEVFLKLEPHTKKKHILAKWDWVEAHLKTLPAYRGRNKRWKTYERDLEIFDTYQEMKATMAGKRASHQSGEPGLDVQTWQVLRKRNKEKYKQLTLAQIRKAVSKIAQLNYPTT